MELKEKLIKQIYKVKIPEKYENMQKHMMKYKKKALEFSRISPGDKVIVFCCGTGLDFPYILERIGGGGAILGIDFSLEMLTIAKKKIKENGWTNIELVHEDVTIFNDTKYNEYFDSGVCTLGMSIIPNYKSAFNNLLKCVKNDSEVIIGDMQLAQGILRIFNPISVYLSAPFGGSYSGHQNSKELYRLMCHKLEDVKKKEYMLKSYFIACGIKKKSRLN